MSKLLILLGLLILFLFILLKDSYSKKREVEYKNDERWQQIKLKSSVIVLKFYDMIIVLNCLAFFFTDLFNNHFASITLVKAFLYAFYIMLVRYPVEYFALRYYDQRL
ncbi:MULTISPECIES: hypothetical protein [Enterococcus]|uniref:Integral membrane protein n=1 Tax=Candidatus Enterococcus murrayae TaxID=2815321 RepID=A0ABS3HCI5_9ENTE|nr:hypothetical protein [Enterococcus sp. MJM16]MBO0450630.1 hypothetical protein [Enterococcus sp. MJM16]